MSARIEEIRIQNFRAVENVRLTLQELAFLVGRNGAGKSSLLDAASFVREALTESLPTAISRRGGFSGIYRADAGDGEPLGIGVVMRTELGGRAVRMLYGFELRGDGAAMHIRESLRVSPTASMGFIRDGDDFESESMSRVAVPKGRLVLPLVVTEGLWAIAFDTLAQMRTYEIAPHAIAEPVTPKEPTNLERRGGNAGDVLEEVELRPEAHEAIVRFLGAICQGLVGVNVRFERSKRVILFTQRTAKNTRTFYADQMSQGTLRVLGVLLALHQHPEPSIVLIDEVEDSVHPGALQAILDAVEVAAERFPVVMTTHSTELLGDARATPERVRIVQWKDGVTRLYPLSDGTRESVDPVTSVGDLLRFEMLWPSDAPEVFAGDLLELGA